jgi:hypothetical protein
VKDRSQWSVGVLECWSIELLTFERRRTGPRLSHSIAQSLRRSVPELSGRLRRNPGRARLSERASERPPSTGAQFFPIAPGTLVIRRTARSDGPYLEISHSITPLLQLSRADSRSHLRQTTASACQARTRTRTIASRL